MSSDASARRRQPLSAHASWAHRPARRWLLFGGIVLGFFVLSALFLRNAALERGDYQSYYDGGRAIAEGRNPYGPALAWRDVVVGATAPSSSPAAAMGLPPSPVYVYPPIFAAAFVPLTLLPFEVGSYVWFVALFGSIIGAAYVLTGVIGGRGRMGAPARVAATLGLSIPIILFQPVRASLASGQVDSLLLLFLSLALSAFVRRSDGQVAAWLAFAIVVKPFLGFLVVFLLWKRAYRAAVLCGVITAALFLAPIAFLGTGLIRDFIDVAQQISIPPVAADPKNQSIYGLLLRLFTRSPFTVPLIDAPQWIVQLARAAVVLVAMVASLAAVSRSRVLPGRVLAFEFGLFVVTMLVVSPLSEDIHYSHLALPLAAGAALAMDSFTSNKRGQAFAARLFACGLLIVYLYLSLPSLRLISMAYYRYFEAPLVAPQLFLTGAHVFGLIALYVIVVTFSIWSRRQHVVPAAAPAPFRAPP